MSVTVQSDYVCEESFPSPPPPENFCIRPTRYNYKAKVPRPATYAAESTLHHDLPEDLLGPERLILNEAFKTQNLTVHDRKFYTDERDFQPKHPLAPSSSLIHYIRPDAHLKIQGLASRNMKAYNPFPNRLSETKANFKPHYPEASMYGQAGIFITDHFVHLPENRVNVVPAFTYDDMYSVLRKAHPYMTTYRIYHKNFADELPTHKFLDELYNLKIGPSVSPAQQQHENDCAVKLLIRPMIDPFEQSLVKEGLLPSLDQKRLLPGETRNYAHLKQFFRRPPYSGAAPRVHLPVPHMGMNTEYKDNFDRPIHPNMALNHCHDAQFCHVQPRPSIASLMKVPAMYDTEQKMYGSGKNVSHFIDNDVRDPMSRAQGVRDAAAYRELQKEMKSMPSCGSQFGGGC